MLEDIKKYLNISWEDDLIDEKLKELINQSKASIKALGGVEVDFDKDTIAKELLFNRVRYAYNNSLEYFEENFHSEILRWQLMKGVAEVEQETATKQD